LEFGRDAEKGAGGEEAMSGPCRRSGMDASVEGVDLCLTRFPDLEQAEGRSRARCKAAKHESAHVFKDCLT